MHPLHLRSTPPLLARFRHLLAWLMLGMLPFGIAQAQTITILSTYSEENVQSLLDAFQKSHPEVRIAVISRRIDQWQQQVIHNAILQRADVILTSSLPLLRTLKQQNRLQPLPDLQGRLDCAPVGARLNDPERQYLAYGLAGFGMLWNQKSLARQKLPPPRGWDDLTGARFQGQVLMTTPSRSGTTHVMIEQLLQERGWVEGWKVLLQLGGNLSSIAVRSHAVGDGIVSGTAAVAPILDSQAMPLASNSDHFRFDYFPSFAVTPTYVGLLRHNDAQRREYALKLVRFLFSKRGQSILSEPAHFRVPLSADNLHAQNRHYCAAMQRQKPLDSDTLLNRTRLVQLLYDQLISLRFEQLRATWVLIHHAERMPTLGAEQQILLGRARELASRVPVSASQAADPKYRQMFNQAPLRAPYPAQVSAELARWNNAWQAQLTEATTLARRAIVEGGL